MSDRLSVLLTGGTGFLGARLAARLCREGCRVTALVRPDAGPGALNRAGIAGQVVLHPCAPEPDSVRRCLDASRPDAVIHLASISRGGEDPAAVAAMLAANVVLPTLLLAAMQAAGIRLFLNAGTSWQTAGDGPAYSPFNVYAGTKQAFEDLLACYRAPGLRAITLRLFDTYGPGDTRGKIVDLIAAAALRGTPLAMSPGAQVIDLVHVDDAATAFALALRRLLDTPPDHAAGPHEVYAVSGERLTLRSLAARIADAAGRPAPIDWGGRPYRPREIMRPWAGLSPLPGWRPTIPLDTGLRQVIAAHAASALA